MTVNPSVRIVVFALALVALMSAAAFAQDYDAIEQHLRAQEMDEAVALAESILKENPDDARALYMLGLARLMQSEYEPAAAAFIRTAEMKFNTAASWYNAACAQSLNGDIDGGIASLKKAIDSGFDDERLLESDADIHALREDPRFEGLYTPTPYEPHPWAESVEFTATDGQPVYGVMYRARDKDGNAIEGWDNEHPVLLLCHQSGSNHAEYQPIAPRLAEMGYHCLALDLRGGSWKYGRDNQTENEWKEVQSDRGGGSQAKLDLEGVTAQLRSDEFEGSIGIWGSSYTAGRLFAVIMDNPDEYAVALSFAPGRGFARAGWAAAVTIPVFLTYPPHEYGAEREEDFEKIASKDKVLFAQEIGTHGSSTLRPDANPDGYEAIWVEVDAFLDTYLPVGLTEQGR